MRAKYMLFHTSIYIATCTHGNSQTINRQNRTLSLLKASTKPKIILVIGYDEIKKVCLSTYAPAIPFRKSTAL